MPVQGYSSCMSIYLCTLPLICCMQLESISELTFQMAFTVTCTRSQLGMSFVRIMQVWLLKHSYNHKLLTREPVIETALRKPAA